MEEIDVGMAVGQLVRGGGEDRGAGGQQAVAGQPGQPGQRVPVVGEQDAGDGRLDDSGGRGDLPGPVRDVRAGGS
jgi:hypothetical protein